MLRLQEIAGTNKKSKIALDLNVGASTVTNWAKRGV
ncbi:helix-turn-helix domain-containing protein, partial [Escherichia coli]